MRQLHYEGPRQLGWRDAPEPTIQADHEVVVSTIAATTCAVDEAIIRGMSPFQPPFALGHESVARVVELGDDVVGLKVGDVVSVPYHRTCGVCSNCKSQLPLHCEQKDVPPFLVPSYGVPHAGAWGGMMSEKYRVPWASHALVKIPKSVDPIAAVSVGDNLSDAWSTMVPHIRSRDKTDVLIAGWAGGFGLYAILWAKAAGARSITYIDDDDHRLTLAGEIGADETLIWEKGLKLSRVYDLILHAHPDQSLLRVLLRAAAPGAFCTNVTIFFENVPLPLGMMHMSGVTLQSTYSPTRNFMPQVVDALERGEVDPRRIEAGIVEPENAPMALIDSKPKPIVLFE